MRVTEDAMQDAWVALLERGGPSSVANHERWLRVYAKHHTADDARRAMVERAAAMEAFGLRDAGYEEWKDARRARRRELARQRGIEGPEERKEHAKKAWTVAARNRADRAQNVSEEEKEARRAKRRAYLEAYNERRRKERGMVATPRVPGHDGSVSC